MSDVTKRQRIERARQMRALSDDEREDLIAAAGSVVIDARGRFGDLQRQSALAQEYRRPKKPSGAA